VRRLEGEVLERKEGLLKRKGSLERKVELQDRKCSTTGKPTRSFATERVSLDSV
jgi:hypothetical protein